jgi:hypothetical protein
VQLAFDRLHENLDDDPVQKTEHGDESEKKQDPGGRGPLFGRQRRSERGCGHPS